MKKNVRLWPIVIVLISAITLPLIVYNCFIVRTVESGSGWKHQLGHFGACREDPRFVTSAQCKAEATHRIKGPLFTVNYCDEHWEEEGASYFKYLSNPETWESTSSSGASDDETKAKICAEKAVTDKLKAPSTANFCKYSEMTAIDLGGGRWKISGFVDAENSFGAMLRQHWTVTLTLTSTGFTDYSVSFSD